MTEQPPHMSHSSACPGPPLLPLSPPRSHIPTHPHLPCPYLPSCHCSPSSCGYHHHSPFTLLSWASLLLSFALLLLSFISLLLSFTSLSLSFALLSLSLTSWTPLPSSPPLRGPSLLSFALGTPLQPALTLPSHHSPSLSRSTSEGVRVRIAWSVALEKLADDG